MTATRRLAAIMAVDVVGYSSLMGEDEAGTALAVREHRDAARPIVAGLGGRIVKTMGDGLLLEFPSVVAAVECAVAIQKLMVERNAEVSEGKRIVYRIGVNLGDVLIEGDDILGEGVNIAARLEGVCEPGGVLISSTAHDHVRGKINADFVDLGEKALKNIARPVRVYAVRLGSTSATPAPPSAAQEKAGPPRFSIVVLPFAQIGGDAEQEYFVDGVTESLTTDLSRMRGMLVIGRNTAFSYKGKRADLKQIGRELNVRYVLEGSVQRSGQRMRINVQLIDAASGNHLWAERFDKPLADLFDMQDEIVSRLANQLGAELAAAEARRAERVVNPDSMDHYFRGLASLNQGSTPEHLARARKSFEHSAALDPSNSEAEIGAAIVDAKSGYGFSGEDRTARLAAAEVVLVKALALAPNHAAAHLWLGVIRIVTNRVAQGVAECERALALDRNLADAHGQIGLAKYVTGKGEECEAHIHDALRISPRDIMAATWYTVAGLGKLSLGEDEAAVRWFSRTIETNRNFPVVHLFMAAALVHLGRGEEARVAAATGLALDPAFTIARFRASVSTDNSSYLARRERIYDGMRKAGVPEG